MSRVLTLSILILVTLVSNGAQAARYRVQVSEPHASVVHVRGEFVPMGDTIGMYFVEAPELRNGSADLVEDLVARTAGGTEIALEALGGGDWRMIGADPDSPIVIEYDLRLEHERFAWGPGIDEVAYRTDDGLFFSGRALFLVPLDNPGVDGVTLEFDLPSGWKASLPWPEVGGVVRAPDVESMVFNCMFLGTHAEETVQIDDFTLVLAVGNALREQRALFVETMRPALREARRIFGGMPRADRFLAVVNSYPRTDGGAYEASYSLLVAGEVSAGSSVLWGHGMVHEVLHFWNGRSLTPSDHRGEWFREGVTDYLTLILRARLGHDPLEITWRRLENAARRQLLARAMMGVDVALDEAGAKKQRNRMLVYGGGLLAAFGLDLEIRRATQGERGIEDLLHAMFRDFAQTDRTYTQDDLRTKASAIAGTDLGTFFERHVQGNTSIDLDALAHEVGWQLSTMVDEFYLTELEDPSAVQHERRKQIFGAP